MVADVNCWTKSYSTPLHEAIKRQNLQTCTILIDNFADVNSKCIQGKTPLHYACELGNMDLVKLLSNRREIYINIDDNELNKPIHLAAK